MPLSVRARLAILCTLLMLGVLAAFMGLIRTAEETMLRARHRESVVTSAESLAMKIQLRYIADEVLTTYEAEDRPPPPTPMLREMAEAVPGFVWLLHKSGGAIYRSERVRDPTVVEPDVRAALDSVAASIAPGASVIGTTRSSARLEKVAGTSIQTLPLTGGREFLFYAVDVTFRIGGVGRVVVGRLAASTPPERMPLSLPLAAVIPIVIVVSVMASALFMRMALAPVRERIGQITNEVEAITDGRSLHRRLQAEGESEPDEVARLSTTLNAMIGRLEQSFAGLRRFTADASHELKTPLTVLRADVERAMATQADRREQLVALEEALAETARMADLVDSLLTLARADEGRFDLHRVPVELDALAREVHETALLLGEPTGVTVSMKAPPAVTVFGDRARLRQLMLNLVTNAIKYTPSDGQVELSLRLNDGVALFSVRDSGIGIAAADLPHVFERFWRADPARSRSVERSGFGLGLAISQYIAQAHGGSLTVQSRLGRGSTFTVALPVHDPDVSGSAE